MRKETLSILALIISLLLILLISQWLKMEEERNIYGMKLAFSNAQQRSFTWLSASSFEDSRLEIKRNDESWEQGNVVKLPVERSEASYESGEIFYTYRSQVDGLEWGRSYTYRVTANETVISDEFTFYVSEQQLEDFRFIHVTDTQGTTEEDYKQWGKTLRQAVLQAPDAQFIVHGGDLTDDPSKEQEWQWFYKQSPILATMPFLSTTGNHELINGDAQYYQAHLTMPTNGAGELPRFTSYYTSYQHVLLISVNTEADIHAQTAWLKKVLEQQGKRHTWIIVSMHRGLYGANQFEDAEEWGELFDKYEVNLVLQGHNHSYSRSFPIRDNKVLDHNEAGTVYVTLNAAGSKWNEEKKEKFYQAQAFQNGKSMFAIVDVQQNKLIYSAYDADGILLDQFTLSQ